MSEKLGACDISPVTHKHLSTPRRTRSKTSRGEQGIDVHTSSSSPLLHASCSTPITQHSPRINNRSLNSPSPSFPYSQDCPDVVWDYTSPKLTKGGRRKELKLTIQELLENLNQCQVPDCSSQSAPYVKLLEKWMAKQTANTTVKKTEKNKKENKKRSRHVVEDLRKFLDTISRTDKANSPTTSRQSESTDSEQDANNLSKLNMSIKSLLDDDSTDGDSTEELWGDVDNSFIVKATQELELINPISNHKNNHNIDIVSTIPDTAPSPISTSENSPDEFGQKRHSCGGNVAIDVEKCNNFLEQLSDVDWDSDLDADEWDNGFIEEDTLCLIPDEVLTGYTLEGSRSASNKVVKKDLSVESSTNLSVGDASSSKSTNNLSVETMYTVSVADFSSCTFKPVNSAELFNSFDDENFDDESLFLQPEVLSQLDEVENMMSQQPKCTPEEIEKKKDEAIKKRLRTRSSKKTYR